MLCLLLIPSAEILAQNAILKGFIYTEDSTFAEEALVVIKDTRFYAEPDLSGRYEIRNIPYGTYNVYVIALGREPVQVQVVIDSILHKLDFRLTNLPVRELDLVRIMVEQERSLGVERLRSVHNFTVYEGKKNEVVFLKNISANMASNNARQLYGTITGLNIWESDGAGLQLGVGGRGLSPNRTSNFNTRQNGYDISADALGYPESYYTPVAEALERIEVIRGAAGLQYGSQFGGMLNFVMKKGRRDVPFEYVSRQTYGSWNFINSFHSFGGTSRNKRISYYSFLQRKQGDGWRPNSAFTVNNFYAQVNYQLSSKTLAGLEFTHMDYLAKQAGGLTDALFEQSARQSVRSRNWFQVKWNLLALNVTHRFSRNTQMNIRSFGLLANRMSLGNLERINVFDFNKNRTLIEGVFNNIGSEARLLHRYVAGKRTFTLLAGVRLYAGKTTARQGDGDSLSGPDFDFKNPGNLEGSDYQFPNYNYSAFTEHIFSLSDKLTITPGLRFENIQTYSQGYYRQRVFDFAGNVIADRKIFEDLERKRNILLAGVGISYKPDCSAEIYGNISRNYRAINFTDLRVQNPNFRIDSNLRDEKGFTADLGIRGGIRNFFTYEVTAFYLFYNNRIGQVLRADQPPLYIDYRFRTNVAASRNIGIESFFSLNLARLWKPVPKKLDWTIFTNVSIIDARYIRSEEASIQGKKVEMVPPVIVRTGTTCRRDKWKAGFQINYVAEHFSDATNAVKTSTAVEGVIPSYVVADVTGSFICNSWLSLEASCNNVFNNMYFTRRAESYPGPGIIPSDGRSFYLTAQISLNAK